MKANYVLAAITILVSLFFLILAFQLPEASSTTVIGSADWPIMILVFTIIMGVLLILTTWLKSKKGIVIEETEQQDEMEEFEQDTKLDESNVHVKYRHFYLLLAIGVYVALLPIVGFIIMTPILFFVLCWLLGMGKIWRMLIVTIVSNIAIILLFIFVLGIPFPRGIGIFRSLSFLIY